LCKILSVICKHILGNDNKKSATFYDFVLVFKRLSGTLLTTPRKSCFISKLVFYKVYN